MLTNAGRFLRYPIRGSAAERPLLAGWILVTLSFVIPVLPAIPFLGYLLRVLLASVDEADPPALLIEPVALLRRGVGAVVVALAYLIAPLVALFVTAYGALWTAPSLTDSVSTLTVYAGSTVIATLTLLGLYLLPVGLYGYARSGKLRGAFSPGTLRRYGAHGAYFYRWTGGGIAAWLTVLVGRAAFSLPRIGPVAAGLVVAYGAIQSFHVWGGAIALARQRSGR